MHHVVLGILMCRFGGDWHSTYLVFFNMNAVCCCTEKPLDGISVPILKTIRCALLIISRAVKVRTEQWWHY